MKALGHCSTRTPRPWSSLGACACASMGAGFRLSFRADAAGHHVRSVTGTVSGCGASDDAAGLAAASLALECAVRLAGGGGAAACARHRHSPTVAVGAGPAQAVLTSPTSREQRSARWRLERHAHQPPAWRSPAAVQPTESCGGLRGFRAVMDEQKQEAKKQRSFGSLRPTWTSSKPERYAFYMYPSEMSRPPFVVMILEH